MKVENLAPDLILQFYNSVCTFSDDSRLIYLVSFESGNFDIRIYDILFNKFIILTPDSSVSGLFDSNEELEQHRVQTSQLDVEIIDQQTLCILFHDFYHEDFEDMCALVMMIKLDFDSMTFSLVDKRLFDDCYYAALLKDDASHILLLHSFAVNKDEFENNQYLGYFPILINDNKICQSQNDRITLNFDYQPGPYFYDYHFTNNKLWILYWRSVPYGYRRPFSLPAPRLPVYAQLSYIDLGESNSKEVKVELIDTALGKRRWLESNLIYYDEKEAEFAIFNLTNKNWSRIRNNPELLPFGEYSQKLVFFNSSPRLFGTGRSYQHLIDGNFNVIFIDKTQKQLQRIPLKTPFKLAEIAWITALNYGLLDQSTYKLPKNLIFSPLF